MQSLDRARLRATFLTALASAGCSPGASPDVPETANVRAPNPLTRRAYPRGTLRDALVDAELAEQFRQEGQTFSSADLRAAGALPFRVLNVVQGDGVDGVFCDTIPCEPETQALSGRDVYQPALFVNSFGTNKLLFEADVKAALGTIETKEEAVALLATNRNEQLGLAQCADLERYGAPCAEGSDPLGVPVRAAEGGGFDVVLFGATNVCEANSFGLGEALVVVRLTPTGEIDLPESALSRVSGAISLVEIRPCMSVSRGRMFEGYVDLPVELDLRAYLVRAARQEAAAVHAFARLAGELARFGAPDELVEAARRGVDEEARHARLFEEAIAGLGEAEERAPERDHRTSIEHHAPPEVWRERTLLEVLVENALEGCANETYAALVATHQAEAARGAPAPLRPLFAAIADDERAHAALAFEIHRWGREQLDEDGLRVLDTTLYSGLARMARARPSDVGLGLGEPPSDLVRRALEQVVVTLAA
jgi:hypothetical protein